MSLVGPRRRSRRKWRSTKTGGRALAGHARDDRPVAGQRRSDVPFHDMVRLDFHYTGTGRCGSTSRSSYGPFRLCYAIVARTEATTRLQSRVDRSERRVRQDGIVDDLTEPEALTPRAAWLAATTPNFNLGRGVDAPWRSGRGEGRR